MEPGTLFLLIAGVFVFLYLGFKIGQLTKDQEWEEKLPKLRKASVEKSREVLTGKFSEQLAPFMPDFPYSPTECRFLGKPIDLVVFKGLDNKEPEEVVFVEIKTGQSKLSKTERKLRDVIRDKKITWKEYRLSSSQQQA